MTLPADPKIVEAIRVEAEAYAAAVMVILKKNGITDLQQDLTLAFLDGASFGVELASKVLLQKVQDPQLQTLKNQLDKTGWQS